MFFKKIKFGGKQICDTTKHHQATFQASMFDFDTLQELKYLPELPTIQEKTIDRYSRRLYTFDCPMLSDMEHCYSIVFSWMTKNLEVYLVPRMEIVIPGSEIPKWLISKGKYPPSKHCNKMGHPHFGEGLTLNATSAINLGMKLSYARTKIRSTKKMLKLQMKRRKIKFLLHPVFQPMLQVNLG
ncbi:hypothetical protein LR48_Vigan08g080200 [Vigna angularis]|uniref:Uncharacterized protein n=1 Tax=Phaseolus angularis TaxID=3914 RepID=A0A0L9V4L0_PHAAN|nr:hypothetical protein LR48_Vigan08g080200 [Vigna angularis]